jgi:uncharacterized membrane protein
MRPTLPFLAGACALLLAACDRGDADTPAAEESPAPATAPADVPAEVPGDTADTSPFAGIAEDEVLRFTGTEPFWGGQVSGGTLTYSTPENQDGTAIPVERFAGRGGIGLSGTLGGAAFDMTVTGLACSDGMSDRTYPFTVTLEIGDDKRNGCGWSERHPFEGPEHP